MKCYFLRILVCFGAVLLLTACAASNKTHNPNAIQEPSAKNQHPDASTAVTSDNKPDTTAKEPVPVRTEREAWAYYDKAVIFGEQESQLTYSQQNLFQKGSVSVKENLILAQGLKGTAADTINQYIRERIGIMEEQALHEFDFTTLLPPQETIENYTAEFGFQSDIGYLGPYASVQLSAYPVLIHNNEGWRLDTKDYLPAYTETAIFDLRSGEQATVSSLFAEGIDYMQLMNHAIWKDIQGNYYSQEDLLKRPFTGLSEEDILVMLQGGIIIETYIPYIIITAKNGNPFFDGQYTVYVPYEAFEGYLSFSLHEMYEVVAQPENLGHILLSRQNQLKAEKIELSVSGYEESIFVQLADYNNQMVLEKINNQLLAYQKEWIENNPFKGDTTEFSFIGLDRYEVIGPFLVASFSARYSNGENWHNQYENITFDLTSGKQLTARDLLREECLDQLTPEQKQVLDEKNFYIPLTGDIYFDIPGVEVFYPEEYFDYNRFQYF